MNEEQLAQQLKQNIPEPEPYTPPPPVPVDTSNGQALEATTIDLDEITQYKLHDLFGEQYKPSDEVTRQRLSYIYTEVAAMVPEADYGFIAAKIRDLQRMVGIAHADNKIYRLYQWLKLNNVRRNIDAEMGAITSD